MPGPANMKFKKPKHTKATLLRVMGYFKPYTLQMILVVFGIIVSAAAGVAGTYMLKPIINDDIIPLIGQSDPDMTGLITSLVTVGLIYVLGCAGNFMYSRIMIDISTGTTLELRKQMFTAMERLPINYFDKRTHGEIMSRYTNDTDAMRELLSQSIPQFINSIIRIVGVFVMMLVLSPVLTGLAVLMLVLMIFVTSLLAKKSGFYFRKRQESLGKVNGYIEEMVEGQKVVKMFSHEREAKAEFNVLNAELQKNVTLANTWAMVLMPIMNNLSHINYVVTAAAGGLLAVSGGLDLGTIASFLEYSRNFSMPIVQVSQQFNSVMSALAGAERIFELIDGVPETDEGSVTMVNVTVKDGALAETAERTGEWAWRLADGELREVKGDVRFSHVTFSYDGEKDVLKDISLFAKPGQKIALVGSTGAGKTTITNLLNRFYDIREGSITYDGIPIQDIRKDDLRRSLSMVLQDTHLFTGTVMENIRYGRLDASDNDVVAAAKLAGANGFISHLPKGYDTVLMADGANLSQGQRQLIAIARAAVADPPVLVLDEATSSIDTRTEHLIERGMDKLMQGRTVFVIAHRLSTVRNSNAIMVLENGEIIERGDHDELLAQKGKYYQLYMGMFELS